MDAGASYHSWTSIIISYKNRGKYYDGQRNQFERNCGTESRKSRKVKNEIEKRIRIWKIIL